MTRLCSLCTIIALISVAVAYSDMAPPPSVAERVSRADEVVVGTVSRMEPKNLTVLPYWGGNKKLEHMVAVVKIEEAIVGAKGLTHLRVGFIPSTGGLRYRPTQQLKVGEKVCLFLHKHPKQSIHVLSAYYDKIALNAKAPQGFLQQVKLAKQAAKLRSKPESGLADEDATTRYLTAAMLISRYRTLPGFRDPGAKISQKPIDARESTLILNALAGANWTKPPVQLGYMLQPQYLFQRLGISTADGFTYPKNFRERIPAMQKWLKANAGKYRIKKYVVEQ